MSKIYVATSGTGKTDFCKTHLNWVDLDWALAEYFPGPFAETIFSRIVLYYKAHGYNIMINNFRATNALVRFKIPVDCIIMPKPEIKDEIINRLSERDQNSTWATEYSQIFDTEMEALNQVDCQKIYLESGQYVSDIINADGSLKE